jgi:predicted nucleic acid-binding protein
MVAPEIVLDTNVLVAGLRSSRGAAHELLTRIGSGTFGINVSVPLLLEYEDVLLRPDIGVALPPGTIRDILDYHCAVARHHAIYFLWRPCLPDPGDDMVLELAVKAGCTFIVTFNQKDFAGCERFGIDAITPGEFLRYLRGSG